MDQNINPNLTFRNMFTPIPPSAPPAASESRSLVHRFTVRRPDTMPPQNFYLVATSYTDGLLVIKDESGNDVPNHPDPNTSDAPAADGTVKKWRQCVETDVATKAKADNFKRTLGQGILDTVRPPAHNDYPWVLEFLPLGFTLWELNSYTVVKDENGKETKKSKRSDTYLFGHPGGITKKYRSPNDFLPHLLWILQDPTHDRSKCLCRHCKATVKRARMPTRAPEMKEEEQPRGEENSIIDEENTQMGMDSDLGLPSATSAYPDLLSSHYSSPYPSNYPHI